MIISFSLFSLHQTDFVDLADLFAGLGNELHTDLFLVLEQFGRYGIGLVLKFGDTVLARIVHLLHQYIVDENIKLMALPLAYAPVFQTERSVSMK